MTELIFMRNKFFINKGSKSEITSVLELDVIFVKRFAFSEHAEKVCRIVE